MPLVPLSGAPAFIAIALGLGGLFVVLAHASRRTVRRTVLVVLCLAAIAAGGALGLGGRTIDPSISAALVLGGGAMSVIAAVVLFRKLDVAERALTGAFADSADFERESQRLVGRNAALQARFEHSQAQLAETAVSASSPNLLRPEQGEQVREMAARAEAAESSARQSSARFDEISDAVAVLHPQSLRIVEFNAGLVRLTGRSGADLAGCRLEEVIDAAPSVMRRFDRERVAHAGDSRVVPITRADGAIVQAELRIGRAGEGDDRQIVAVLRDVTRDRELDLELRMCEQKLALLEADAAAHECAVVTSTDVAPRAPGPTTAALEKLVDREWGSAAQPRQSEVELAHERSVEAVAHDLRVPLTSIRSFSEILLEHDDVPRAERREFLQIIRSESHRLSRMVNDLLDVRRIRSGAEELELEDMDARDLVRDGLASLSGLALSRNVSFEGDWERRERTLRGDRDRLHRVVANLLSNAVKFSPEGGVVEVILRDGSEEGAVRLGIRDHGPGIPEEDHEVVFERFSRGAKGPENVSGTGLGLSICREIVEVHGARIWPESRPQSGATMWVEFPPPANVGNTSVNDQLAGAAHA